MPDGEPFAPMQTIPVATDSSIIMVQRSGAMAAIDLADGKTVLWSKKNVLEQVHLVARTKVPLRLAGMSRDIERRTPSGASTSAGLVPRRCA